MDVKMPDGNVITNVPDDITQSQLMKLYNNGKMKGFSGQPEKGLGDKINDVLGDVSLSNVKRQAELTARYGLQGVGDLLDTLASPIRAGLNAAGANIHGRTGEAIANLLNLPNPESQQERVVGKGAELLAGGIGPMKAATFLKDAGPVVKGIAESFSETPVQQGASAAGAGSLGEYVKETGGNGPAQFVGALAGGLAAPVGVNAVKSVANAAKSAIARQAPQDINITIQHILDSGDGVQYAELGQRAKALLRQDVENAMKSGGKLDADAVRRLADYRAVGATPKLGTVTLDPVQITREKNLSKMGANTSDGSLQALSRVENDNNSSLIDGLNALGAGGNLDAVGAGKNVIGALDFVNNAAKGVINKLYDIAKASAGRSVPLDGAAFTRQADDLLKKNLLQGRLPADIREHLNNIAQGNVPFDVDYAEQLKTLMGNIQRSQGTDNATKTALGFVRDALENTPAMSDIGEGAINAFNQARRVNRGWMNVVDRTPALQAVRDGVEPDKFVQQYIIGNGNKSNVLDVLQLKNLIKNDPQAMDSVRGQILGFIKEKALNGASDEVGKVSQSALNKAINSIGDRKLSAFFSSEEIAQLKALGRVASYEQVQPIGSAVNNSNSGALALGGMLDFMANNRILSRIPMADMAIRQPARNFSTQLQINQAQNIPAGLLAPSVKPDRQYPLGLLMAPLIGNSTTQQ